MEISLLANSLQVRALRLAVSRLEPRDFRNYVRLRKLLPDHREVARSQFKSIFASYYGMNRYVTDAFKERFFTILFGFNRRGADPYTRILLDLSAFERPAGGSALYASFVTKLVAIHDESSPIFDRRVSEFFGLAVPDARCTELPGTEFRIAGFVQNLRILKETYEEWALDPKLTRVLENLKEKHPDLGKCHSTRLFDLLVWIASARVLNSS
jgi:hypothetical protein